MFKHVLLPTDGTELSQRAVEKGVEFARIMGARLTGLYVCMPFQVFALDGVLVGDSEEEYERESKALADRHLATIAEAAAAAGVPCELVQSANEHPYLQIVDTAKERGCDVIFMASHGRRGMAALLLGSETTKVLTHTDIPVMVYR
jgi:nucleotide-binding universal stress UspA family protein